jgi:hypothetical protein
MPKPKKEFNSPKYNDQLPVDVFILAKSGIPEGEIAKAINISTPTFIQWKKKYPAIKYALERAAEIHSISGASTIKEYVYKQLPPDLKHLWDKIEIWHDHPSGLEKIEELFARQPQRARQSLWLHALIECNFNQSEACRRVGVSRNMVLKWAEDDPDFPKLLEELDWHQKNFLENGLMSLVAAGNTLATVFANRTRNRDRGYGDKLSVEVSGQINVNHNHTVSIDQLKLPLEVRKQVLQAIRDTKPALGDDKTLDIKALPAIQRSDEADEEKDV